MAGRHARQGDTTMIDELVTHAEILAASLLGGGFAIWLIVSSVPA